MRVPGLCPGKTDKKDDCIPSIKFSSALAVTKDFVVLFSSEPPIINVSKTVVLIG